MHPWLAQLLDEAEARQLPALIDAWQGFDDARTWIARALRIDLALAIERPEIVLPALYRRCVRFGDDERFFKRNIQPRHAREASALVEEWIAAWAPGRHWLRSLWPAAVALDAGVVAEYRTEIAGQIVFSSDGLFVGSVGNTDRVVWERATGRRMPGAQLDRPPRDTDWEVEDVGEGRIVLVTHDRKIEIAVGGYEEANGLDVLSPEIAMVRGIDGDGYVYWLVDLVRGRIITQGEGVPMAYAGAGQRCYVAVRDVIHAFDGGGPIGSWTCPKVTSLAIAPDHLIATRSDHVIRLWDPDLAIAAGVQRATDEPLPATTMWSPDGALLFSSGRLVDASTGNVITELRVADWSGAIEGGPPDRYQAFTELGVVETSTRGLRVWDRGGALVLEDRERIAWSHDGVAIDPTGRRLALHRGDRLSVTALLVGTLVFEQEVELAGGWGDLQLGFTDAGELWWETKAGERWLLAADSVEPQRTETDAPPFEGEPALESRDGLLVVGDAALPVDEPVKQAPHGQLYAGCATLIRLVD